MRVEEIDDALRRTPAWEPPPGFARRVARLALTNRQDEQPVRVLDVILQLPAIARGMVVNSSTVFAGVRWTLRQYWLLLAR